MTQIGAGAAGNFIEEEEPKVRQIEGVPTMVPGIVAICERGPVGLAVAATDFGEWQRTFGGDIVDGDGCHEARAFFAEGGQLLYTVRTVHYTDVDTPASKTSAAATLNIQTGATGPTAGTVLGTNVAPFNLEPGDTIVTTIDGGSPHTATFTAVAAARESGAGTFNIPNASTLTVAIDGGTVQTISFVNGNFVDHTAATAAEVAAVINAQIVGAHATVTSSTKVTITSDKRGTGSHVNITGGSANAGILAFTTGVVNGTGNVANIDAVTAAEIITVVEAAEVGCTVVSVGGAIRISSNTTGGSSSVLVGASSSADDELGLDNATHSGSAGAAEDTIQIDGRYDGTYADGIQIKISNASSGAAAEFDLAVIDNGLTVQTFSNLTMDPDAPRFLETIANDTDSGSPLVTFLDLGLPGTAAQRRPANGTSGLLTGGDDGLASLDDNDFVGSEAGKTGLYALDLVDDLSVLAVPDRATSATHNAMISYCEVHRSGQCFPVLDPPANMSATEIVEYVETTAAILEASEFGGIFWPRVKVLNPQKSLFGSDTLLVVPPSGVVMGVMARGDQVEGGVYKPAAGIERGRMTTVLGFETDEVLDSRKRDLVFPKNINPLSTERGKPRFIDGYRTLKSTGNFPSISERRGVIYIEQSIKSGTVFARHSNNDDDLLSEVDRTVYLFLIEQMKLKAFRSQDPDTAFFVDLGRGLNTDAVRFAKKIIGRVGLATQKPAEFVIFRFSQDTRALETAAAG